MIKKVMMVLGIKLGVNEHGFNEYGFNKDVKKIKNLINADIT